MSIADTETTTYRGESLEELLPQIRDELGPDAVITRQREGIVGGIGGFFGKKCIEIEARRAERPPERAAVPPRAIVDAYDTGVASPVSEPEREDENPLLRTLMAQTSPFAEQLTDLLERAELEPFEPALGTARPAPPPTAPEPAESRIALVQALTAAGVPRPLAESVLAETERTLVPFEPDTPLRELARRTLARQIKVSHGWKSKRRTIALVGPAGSGRTLTAAKLCHAYASTGCSVTALSLEPARTAMRLATLTDLVDVGLEVADAPELATRARRTLRAAEVVIADTAPLDAGDPATLDTAMELLEALKPDETHLLIPAGASLDAGRALLYAVWTHAKPSRLLVTHADEQTPTGVPVGLSLAAKIPISFVADGPLPVTGVHPAEPDELARMVLQ